MCNLERNSFILFKSERYCELNDMYFSKAVYLPKELD